MDCRITDCKVAVRDGSIISVAHNHFGVEVVNEWW